MKYELIQCACGCGKLLSKFDNEGKIRRYAPGHNTLKTTDDAVLTFIGDRCVKVREISQALNCSPSTISRVIQRLRQRGKVAKLKGSSYCQSRYADTHLALINPLVICACGCGGQFRKFDAHGRKRKFISGHNGRK